MIRVLRLLLAAVVLLAATIQIGCGEWTEDDKAMVKDLVQDWLESKNMSPTNPDKSLNIIGGLRFAAAVAGKSDDEEANAVFGIYTSVSGVIGADKAMEEALANGDAAAMDKVIESRPHDWTYRSTRASLALAQGDIATYNTQSAESIRMADAQGVPSTRQARQVIKDFDTKALPDTGEQGYLKHMNLYAAYETLYNATGDEAYAVAGNAHAIAAEAARE